ncbi:MAG: DUF4058 family protein [Cyanobacteria bacterium J06632_22]
MTAVELLSPSNKRAGQGREHYLATRLKMPGSRTHLVEIDLLRAHPPMPFSNATVQSAYRILVSRTGQRPHATLYPFGVQDAIPRFHFPLVDSDTEPVLNLGILLNQVYDRASYDLAIDYSQPLQPSLTEDNQRWVEQLLRD